MGVAAPSRAALKKGLWQRIKSVALADVGVLVRGLDTETLEQMERVLIEADFGPSAFDLVEEMKDRHRRGEMKNAQQLHDWLAARLISYLDAPGSRQGLDLGDGAGPGVILMLGVNGAGKTTFTAKLARSLQSEGRSVLLAAADTYRAAATEQLAVWAQRLGVECVTGAAQSDPAAVAYDAIEAATARTIDVVLVDTAGRLHTQRDLMGEITKIAQVIGKKRPGAPHERLLVLDGTVGQNALQQGKAFAAALPLTGLVITKLDGTAKGGAVIAIERELKVPIRFIGTGETVEDLEAFDPQRFVERLLED